MPELFIILLAGDLFARFIFEVVFLGDYYSQNLTLDAERVAFLRMTRLLASYDEVRSGVDTLDIVLDRNRSFEDILRNRIHSCGVSVVESNVLLRNKEMSFIVDDLKNLRFFDSVAYGKFDFKNKQFFDEHGDVYSGFLNFRKVSDLSSLLIRCSNAMYLLFSRADVPTDLVALFLSDEFKFICKYYSEMLLDDCSISLFSKPVEHCVLNCIHTDESLNAFYMYNGLSKVVVMYHPEFWRAFGLWLYDHRIYSPVHQNSQGDMISVLGIWKCLFAHLNESFILFSKDFTFPWIDDFYF